VNTQRQRYIFEYFGWRTPEYIHYGIVSLRDAVLKTSKIKEGIRAGRFAGWSDVRLATLRALARRGITAEALRNCWLEIGVKEVDINFSWENLYAHNRRLVDPRANRYFFVWQPQRLELLGVEKLVATAPYHPSHTERGVRKYTLTAARDKPIRVYVTAEDIANLKPGACLRLKHLCNIELLAEHRAKYLGTDVALAKRKRLKIIHWVPVKNCRAARVLLPDGTVCEGFAEAAVANARGIIQFERFGFVKVEGFEDNVLVCCYAHR
jgi:glutamyl-tRNA synthetase